MDIAHSIVGRAKERQRRARQNPTSWKIVYEQLSSFIDEWRYLFFYSGDFNRQPLLS